MKPTTPLLAAILSTAFLLPSVSHAQDFGEHVNPFVYTQTNLVADMPGIAVTTDPLLQDPWGLAAQPNSPFWINDRATGVSSLYDGNGAKVPATFTVPGAAGAAKGSPTGLVWNPSSGFLVPGTQLTSVFIFATLDGTIAAWAPHEPMAPTNAVTAIDNSKAGASYTGLEFGVNDQGAFLYAANVKSGQIDVFDATFQPAGAKLPGKFVDPALPAGFVPFGIHAVNGNLAVTYARQNAAKNFVTPAQGAGFVDIFDTNGNLVERLAGGGLLNAPWGVAAAPEGFGGMSGQIIVGNFGDGRVLAFGHDGDRIEIMLDKNRQPIAIPGLWSLNFGGGAVSDPRTLFFTAGTGRGQHGLFGALNPVQPIDSGHDR
jgi:uncharacterized protein (TIGR03118 family)